MRLAVIAALGLTGASACGGGGPGAQPGWRRETRRPGTTIEFRPKVEAAARYNEPVNAGAPASPLGDSLVALVQATAEANGREAPEADARLFAVAGELAAFMGGDEPPSYDVVEFALAYHGIIEPSPHLIMMRAGDAEPEPVVRELGGRLPAIVAASRFRRVGVGVAPAAGGGVTVVLALQESGLQTQPIPRQAGLGAKVAIRGKVLFPYDDPRVYVTAIGGEVDAVPLVRETGGGFRAEVACGSRGRIKVEVVGHDGDDPNVLANFPIWCGEEPPASIAVTTAGAGTAVSSASEAELALFALLNEDRRAAGLAPLAWDERAAGAGRAHSEDMRDSGFVGHVSPTTGAASDRARAAGILTPLVLENVARAYSPEEAELGLMNSPGHRANILSADATHAGIGVALGAGVGELRELYVTQLFFRVTPALDAKALRKDVARAIAAGRAAAGRRALESDRFLQVIAQDYAEALALGRETRAALAEQTSQKLDKLGNRFSAVVSVVQVVGDPEQASGIGKMLDADVDTAGVGVAQGTDPTLGENAIFVVVLAGQI